CQDGDKRRHRRNSQLGLIATHRIDGNCGHGGPGTNKGERGVNLFDLSGKVAIVTGGNGGIGLGIALGLAKAGAKIAVLGRNAAKSESAAQTIRQAAGVETLVVTADVSRPDHVDRAVVETLDKFDRIDILFNNAGINIRKQPESLALSEWL